MLDPVMSRIDDTQPLIHRVNPCMVVNIPGNIDVASETKNLLHRALSCSRTDRRRINFLIQISENLHVRYPVSLLDFLRACSQSHPLRQHADSADTATTATSAASAVKASQDGSGNDIAATYVKQSDVQLSLQQLQNGTIVVGRATGDASGNDIAATYATKAEVPGAGGGAVNASGSHPDLVAGTANFALQADQAVYASSAGSAEFAEIAFQADAATSDGLGNNIAETYATKAELAAAAVSAASAPAAVSAASAPAAASASVPGSAVGKASLSAEGDTAGALCRHDLLVCGGETAFTATIFSRDASPFGTAQALLRYLGGAGYRVAEGPSPLPASGCCGGATVYGIGAHAAFPQSLGILCGGAGQEPAAAHLAADGLTVTDHVTEM